MHRIFNVHVHFHKGMTTLLSISAVGKQTVHCGQVGMPDVRNLMTWAGPEPAFARITTNPEPCITMLSEKVTSLWEIDVSICNIFSRISHEEWRHGLCCFKSHNLSIMPSVSSV